MSKQPGFRASPASSGRPAGALANRHRENCAGPARTRAVSPLVPTVRVGAAADRHHEKPQLTTTEDDSDSALRHAIMSIGFLVEELRDDLARADGDVGDHPMMRDVAWGTLRYLVVEGRPHGDRNDASRCAAKGAVIISTQQTFAIDARRGPCDGHRRSTSGARHRRENELLPVTPRRHAPEFRSGGAGMKRNGWGTRFWRIPRKCRSGPPP